MSEITTVPRELYDKYEKITLETCDLFSPEFFWYSTLYDIHRSDYTTIYDQDSRRLFIFCNGELIRTIQCCAFSSSKLNAFGLPCEYHYFYITKSLKDTIIYDILVEFGAISGDICYVHRGVYVINKQENIRGYEIHHLDYQTNPNASCNNNIENLVKLTPEEHKLLHKDWAIKEEKLKEIITLEDESKKVKQTRASKISDRLKNKICVMYHEKHLTYEQISKKMHCSKSTISNILKNYEYKPKKTNPVKACVEKVVNKLSVLPQKANVIKKGFKANICKTLKNFKESIKKSQILNSSVCRYIYRTYKSSNLNSIILSCYKYVLQSVYHVVKAKPPE